MSTTAFSQYHPKKQPLANTLVLVTRASEQASELLELLEKRGAKALECPAIKLVPVEDWQEVDTAIDQLAQTDWLILTSANGVNFFFERMHQLGLTNSKLRNCKLCVVGPKTALALARWGMKADLIPAEYTAEGVVAAFKGIDLQGKQVLFPKADKARNIIPPALAAKGALVHAPVLYCNQLPDTLPEAAVLALAKKEVDLVIFSASSTVKNLSILLGGAERLKELLSGVLVASIGPITSRTCNELGIKVDIESADATLDALMLAMENFYAETDSHQKRQNKPVLHPPPL